MTWKMGQRESAVRTVMDSLAYAQDLATDARSFCEREDWRDVAEYAAKAEHTARDVRKIAEILTKEARDE